MTKLPVNLTELSIKFVCDEVNVIEWRPGPDAIAPPEQVHILLHLPTLGGWGAIRLKSRRVADELIAALRVHTDAVWPVP